MNIMNKFSYGVRSYWNSLVSRVRKIYNSTGAVRKSLAYENQIQEIDYLENRSDDYRSLKANEALVPSIRTIAFYLPQFHPIEQNNEWWGSGFTEWTNVVRGRPQFRGHYQPHLPGELGFYDLRLTQTQQRQVQLAQNYGIQGFCFYFYWFHGTRLLELPLRNWDDSEIEFPYCICWANENWTRRWDGRDSEILISQEYSEEDDKNFIRYVSQYLKKDNYIRVAGKPFLIIYRPGLLPNVQRTMDIWREYCHATGIGEIYIGYIESKEFGDPAKFGCDVAIEFPPNGCRVPNVSRRIEYINRDFGGTIKEYGEVMQSFISRNWPSYRLIKGVCPSWDNEPRRRGRGTVLINSTPTAYSSWVRQVVQQTFQHVNAKEERFIFINAWNEWAEGAHLEPDRFYGYAWLQATYDGLRRAGGKKDSNES